MQVWWERKPMNQSLKGFPLPRNAGMTRKKDYESELKRKSLHGSVKTLQNLMPVLQHDGMWHTSQQKWLCVRSSRVIRLLMAPWEVNSSLFMLNEAAESKQHPYKLCKNTVTMDFSPWINEQHAEPFFSLTSLRKVSSKPKMLNTVVLRLYSFTLNK